MTVAPPMLAVDDVELAVLWWRDRLGFRAAFVHHEPPPDGPLNFAAVERDDVEVHLARRAELSDRRRAEITITVADLESLAEELGSRGLTPARLPTRALAVADPSGNRIVFRAPPGSPDPD